MNFKLYSVYVLKIVFCSILIQAEVILDTSLLSKDRRNNIRLYTFHKPYFNVSSLNSKGEFCSKLGT